MFDANAPYVVTAEPLRLRQLPTTSAPIVTELALGATVVRMAPFVNRADGYAWLNVMAGTDVGFCASRYLRSTSLPPFALPVVADYRHGRDALWPYIEEAGSRYGVDARVVAAIMLQESGWTNWQVHHDGTGHGLFGLDDNGLLPDYEAWIGAGVGALGRGYGAQVLVPELQIEYACDRLALYAERLGGAYTAARAWHRGEGLYLDAAGANYEQLIRAHVTNLFGAE